MPDLEGNRRTSADLVVISTPNRTHVPLALAALEAGLAVVVDKPLAASVADAERLVASSHRLDRLSTAFHNAPWANTFLTTRAVITGSMLGRITRYEARMDATGRNVRAPGESCPNRMKAVACCLIWPRT
jgi:predicted dehydrogenase